MENVLDVENLTKRYGSKRALDGLTMHVPRGCIMGLVGSNGAGKTTLMSISSGLVRPSGGRIDVLGQGRFDVMRHGGRVTILPQDSGLPYYARVGEILMYYGRLQGMSGREARRSMEEVLDLVNLSGRRRDTVRSLSHGMFRRLTIAQALLGKPELMMLDEPMSGLDPKEVANMREVIRACAGAQTILVSSHILTEVETLCDEVVFIELGKRVRQESMDSLLGHDHTVQYLLGGPEPPLAKIRELVEQADSETHAGGVRLSVMYSGDSLAQTNAKIIPLLLASGCEVLEVRRGTDLEAEYLKQRAD